MISIIVAMSRNRVIGMDGKLPWHLPSDLAHFKRLTIGHPVIMGRKTYESLPSHFRPLPGRSNIVLSQSNEFRLAKGTVCHSWEETRELVAKCREAFVIGGESIFKLALPFASMIHLTRVLTDHPGDRFFPEFDEEKWKLAERTTVQQGEKDEFPFWFETYRRQ